ncbi:MAG: hypothetical protein WC657_06095 [Candidatus Paceibacterota bacterium]
MTPSPAPAVKGWRIVALVYVYERDASVETPSVPSEKRFGGGGMTVGYSDNGKTMTVTVRQTARE